MYLKIIGLNCKYLRIIESVIYMLLFVTDIDDCTPDPCMNGATCVDQVNDYTCNCVDGYTDKNCQTSKLLKHSFRTYTAF